MFLPKYFFITGGKATSLESSLNAFDEALIKAKIDQCNIVSVSSIIPPDAQRIEIPNITPGTIVFAVLVRMDGQSGETIGAGVGWAWGKAPDGTRYGIVAEAHGHKDNLALDKELKAKLNMMCKARKMVVEEVNLKIEHIDTIDKGKFGCVIAAFVYVPWDSAESERIAVPATVPLPSAVEPHRLDVKAPSPTTPPV